MIINKKILLPNRYGDNNVLIPIEFSIPNFMNIYKLDLQFPELGVSVIYEDLENKIISAIDPSGGPFLRKGGLYNGFILNEISFEKGIGFLLKFYKA